jgi:hypothetical protein
MPFAVTCGCGARLEIDDRFAGQVIHCPDCQSPLPATGPNPARRRTSGLALASIILALAGAFTIVGTVAAIFVGGLALIQLSRNPGRLAGKGYAVAGIVVGALMTAGTVFALSSVEIFGLTALVAEAAWGDKLDYDGPLEVVRSQEGFAIKRPSKHWGVYKPPHWRAGGDLNQSAWDDLLLVLPSDEAVVICFAERVSPEDGIAKCRERFEREFRDMEKVGLSNKTGRGMFRGSPVIVKDTRWPPMDGNLEKVEMQIDKRVGTEDKSFLVRIVKARGDDRMYVALGGVRRSRYPRLEKEIREALDSFRLLPRTVRPDW